MKTYISSKKRSMTRMTHLFLTLLLIGVWQFAAVASPGKPALPSTRGSSISSPAFSPAECTFSEPISVEITAADGHDIYFTTDGTMPAVAEVNKYSQSVVISSSTTVKAIAVDSDGNQSPEATATYTCSRNIGDGFNPESPGNPGSTTEDPAERHRLTVVANPVGAGSPSAQNGRPQSGEKVYVRSDANEGFVFKNWTIEGTVVSELQSFYYVMPDYDVTIVANYEFNPAGPGNPSPEEQRLRHPVVIRTIPSDAGYVSPGNEFFMKENDSRNIYAYPNNGWKFVGWSVNGEQQAQTAPFLEITMDNAAIDVVAHFSYEPSSPGNPGANSFNSTTGETIIDDFVPGELYSALANLMEYEDYVNVSSLIVKGRISQYDLGTIQYLENCASVDLSRTGELTEIPSYIFENLNVSSLVLPFTCTQFGNYVFNGCSNLASLTIHAQEPPVCTAYTFEGFTNKDNCTLYVPASAIELYSNADYWKDFSILPISTDVHTLQINLPEDASDGKYKNNSLEIVNVNTGVRMKYIISDRMAYTFSGLQKDEVYNVYLLSNSGFEIGRIESVIIPDGDTEATIDNLKALHSVSATVLTPDGNDVTSQTTIEWLRPLPDGTSAYLRKGVSPGELPEGQELLCRISLDDKLGTVYAAPAEATFTVNAENNVCDITLSPFRTVTLSGKVVDGDGKALSDASVSISQTLNGKYSKTYTVKTDRKGEWTLSVLDAPETTLTYAYPECINVNSTLGAFGPDVTELNVGNATLKSIVGARISYGFTYSAPGKEETESHYSDYQNVAVEVFNITQNRTHADISLQYPTLAVLDENINTGDQLRLTATSKTGVFNPIEKTVTIDEKQRGEVTFDIVGKGGISASFESTENPGVVAMLYSSKGEFVKKASYSEAKALFSELEDGDYTLVTMGQSDLMNSVLRLSSFDEIGLTEGRDYVKNAVTVESGKLAEVTNTEIPLFDESLFYYTDNTTGFSSNKSSITTGNYLTLRSAIEFKEVYRNDISNVALVVDLPEACDFVEQSVIQGPNLLPYTIDNNRLTIQLGNNYRSQTRFCVIPTTGGSFNATASIVFDYNGKTVTQPIGSAISQIKDLEIKVPSVIAGTSFKVTGTSSPKSEIKIFEDGTLLGTGTANAAGLWNVECELSNPYNLSQHSIHAEIKTPSGTTMTSERKEITYDKNIIRPSSVVMSFWNGWYKRQYTVKWDLLDASCDAHKYDFYTTTPITFVVDFTVNDPEIVKDIVLNVFTSSNKINKLVPIFNKEKKCWIVSADFSSSSLPTNVSVDYKLLNTPVVDSEFLQSNLFKIDNDKEEIEANLFDFNNCYNQLIEELDKEDADYALIEQLQEQIIKSIKIGNVGSDKTFTIEEITAHINAVAGKEDPKILEGITSSSIFNENLAEYSNGMSITTCDGIIIDDLIENGYQIIEQTNQENSYVFSDEKLWRYVDPSSNVCISVDLTSEALSTQLQKFTRASDSDGYEQILEELSQRINTLVSSINGILEGATGRLYKMIEEEGEDIALLIEERDYLKKAGTADAKYMRNLEKQIANSSKKIKDLDAAAVWIEKNFKNFMSSGGKIAGKTFSIAALITDGIDAVRTYREMRAFRDKIKPPCEKVRKEANNLWTEADGWVLGTGVFYAGKLTVDIAELLGVSAGIAALIPSGGTSTTAILASIAAMAVNLASDFIFNNNREKFMNRTEARLNRLKKKCGGDDDDDSGDGDDSGDDNSDTNPDTYIPETDPQTDPINPILDPSGFVYEAVPENRVEGVQASIYYKETKEDMYGDPYEEVILWDAEEYAQKNPLFTDENGMYQWDVPQGLWQVKFEKDGYQTAYSEWLPVPPPQLEVNIGITQNKQPEVTSARAYEEGVEIQFDKFMDLSTLTADNIYVTANGEKLSGEIRFENSTLADEYASDEDENALRYASRVRFIPAESLSVNTGEIRLTVSRNVHSYAGIPMTETYSQVLDVEKEVQDIFAEDFKVLYGGEKEITIFALPYEAAVGKTLHIATSSELIASLDTTEATLDEEGKAVVKVKGELPGTAHLTFNIDGVTATGECDVDVVTEILTAEPPTASRASGTAVYRGSKIELATESKNATIYYTTDGSCPCDENGTRRVYNEPIVIDGDIQILASTSVEGAEMSEIVEFNYSLKRSDIDFQMPQGWTWISHNLENAIAASELTADEGVSRILSQTREVVRDPQAGMVGTLMELSASESYKVETTVATARKRVSDVAWNPATPIGINPGWNWIGYPVDRVMSVNEAFAATEAETLDVVVGQNGFAQFDGDSWVGTLETMTPGCGYMYQSVSAKNIVYSTSTVSAASARRHPRATGSLSYAVDIHKYGVVMPVIATLKDNDGTELDNEDYLVAAFCGTECRGIGCVVNGMVMMNVYGNINDEITFNVTDAEVENNFSNNSSLSFEEKVVGDLFNPYSIEINTISGVKEIDYDGKIALSVEGDMLRITGIEADNISLVEIYDTNGLKLMRKTSVSESGIRISDLPKGVYVVIVIGNGEYTYHRIALR